MTTVTVSAIQLAAVDDRDTNLDRAAALIRESAAAGASLIVLPEMFSAPFVPAEPDLDYYRWAEPCGGPSNSMVRSLSETLGITVLSSIFEQASVPGVHHNTTCVFTDGRLVHTYRKSHLPFSNGFPEKYFFRPGDAAPSVFAHHNVNVGTITCYERHFPELGRLVALQGAHVMCVPVACASEPTKEVFQLELRAHAAFNSMYVICANRVGTEGTKTYYGMSAICGPDGTILATGSDVECIVTSEIDTAVCDRRRLVLPFFRDRRTDLYTGILENGVLGTALTDARAGTICGGGG